VFIKFNTHILNLDQLVEVGQVEQLSKGDNIKWAFPLNMSNGIGLLSLEYDSKEDAETHRNLFISFIDEEIGVLDSNVDVANSMLLHKHFKEKK
jgi:hypothetical protein